MPSWEYKLISSGPLGFASLPLLEQHLAQLGKDEWEIINFTTKPDHPLVFHGLARRPVARDWFPPAVAQPAYVPPIPADEVDDGKDERSFADELPPARPANAPAPTGLGLGNFDDLGGSEADLPTLFEALKPFLRKNPRSDLSVELDFLAKKFEQDARELLSAFAECGLQVPAPGEEKGAVVDHDGSLYWLERDKKGRVWLNTRDKKFKITKTTPVPAGPKTERMPQASESRPQKPDRAVENVFADTGSFLGRIRSMMRRNRRGHGWSGSFQYLTKALKLADAQLLEKLGAHGLRLEGGDQPVLAHDGDFVFWLNRNQRDEIWINADEKKHGAWSQEQGAEPISTDVGGPGRAYVDPRAGVTATKSLPPENILTAMRLMMEPKKRGEGVTAPVKTLAEKLEKSAEQVLVALASAGLLAPESPKAKPTFAEHGGEIYWLNVNVKGQVWLNAKAACCASRPRPRALSRRTKRATR